MKRIFVLLLITITWYNIANAQTAKLPNMIRNVEGIKEYKLDNGLKILLMSDNSQNNFAVNIIYNVGSRHEGYGETGMAHLLEHMLFKSSKKFVDIKKAIADKGAQANGTTSYDRTNYYEILPASDDNLRWAIEMEADRMINSKILKEELEKEFSVVRNEFEIGENSPSGVLNERILSTMYLWHNYGNSTIGSRADIERVPVENLRAFYKKYYQPDNATIIVCGKFDENKALEYIVKNIGAIAKPTRVLQPTYTVEPAQDGERYVELKRNGDEKIIAMAYHTPSAADADYPINDILVEMLTADGTGILYKDLVDTKLATSVYGYSMPLRDPGFTYFSMNIPLNLSSDSAKKILFLDLDNLDKLNFTQEQLDRAKTKTKKDLDNIMSNTLRFGIMLTEIIASGDYRLIYMYRDQISKVTLDDVKRVAQKYYNSSNRTWGQFIPEKSAHRVTVAETPDIDKLVAGYQGTKTTEVLQSFEATTDNIAKNTVNGIIQNKLKYTILNKPTKGSKIVGQLKLYLGDEKSLFNQDVAGSICADMLKMGTKSRTRSQIKDELDKTKSDINFSISGNHLTASISTDKDNLANTLTILKDLLRNPSFNKEEFEKLVLENKTQLESYKNDPQMITFLTLDSKMSNYPKGHPFNAMTFDDQLLGLNQLKLEDVSTYYNQFFGTNEGYISFVGSIDKDIIVNQCNDIFANWTPKVPYQKIPKLYFPTKKLTETIQIKDKTNAVVAGSMNININQQNPDYAALYMVNQLLGGGSFLSSRIPQRLREAEGMSYGAGSFIDIPWEEKDGGFNVYAFFNPVYKDKLNAALMEELTKASQGTFTDKELSSSKVSIVQERKIALGENRSLVSILNRYKESGLDIFHFDKVGQSLQNLTLQQVNDVAKKYLQLDQFIMIYAGDFTTPAPTK